MSLSSELDDFDRKILRALQENADYSMAELGEKVGLSHTPCWRRIKRLESEGIIKGRVTLLDSEKLNLGVSVHAYVTIKSHEESALNDFETAVLKVEEVVECYSTSGDKDYMLRIVVNSVDHYEKLLKTTLVHLPNVSSINSTFALKQVKFTTQLPI
ncbi:Lrp/AsnC family transcriptional regulator [Marinibactrum halimedae]|uniref:ArsR family transcriptional regulator n=1 Tax=Marinibactrum halimedae TaxID=1444977 RepID=A0AA37T7Q9_9GAMM|nr:Lrp/AsnC family transcriptional regulator [Marinibactrum halimedae]MCD9457893.1 Lrp/AsnC family transcriptional regulator [Marinibactrum halimedae]GLS26282.1 ArsR family transcriptional regulator [Marinibactrum halimedae]